MEVFFQVNLGKVDSDIVSGRLCAAAPDGRRKTEERL